MVAPTAKSGGDVLLGTYARNVSISDDKTLVKWALQAASRALLPDEKIASCLRVPFAPNVGILWAEKYSKAQYCNLVTCGSVWVCPICASKITERRRVELARAVTACNDRSGCVYMQTFTFSHKRFDKVGESLNAFLSARRKSKQGCMAQRLKKRFGIIGTITCLEVTWSELNGWHPHQHELVFFDEKEIDTEEFEAATRKAWEKAIISEGLRINKHGYKLDKTYGGVADYIAKYGHQPTKPIWGIESEMVKGHLKKGRSQIQHYTPFGLLEESYNGNGWASSLFIEFATAFKGRHQLHWSKDLKKKLLDEEEKTDEEIASEMLEESNVLGFLSLDQWRFILGNDIRGELLSVASSGSWEDVCTFLREFGWEE